MLAAIRQRFAKKAEPTKGRYDGPWPRDYRLLRFSRYPEDDYTIEDSFTGLLVMGQTGSGKTSGIGNTVARAMLKAGYGGMVLCAKASEASLWKQLLSETGREKDAIFFGPDAPHRFNFLDYEAARPGGGLDRLEDLVNLLLDIASVRKGEAGSGLTDAAFWIPQKRLLLRNCFSLLLLAKQPLTLSAINALIKSSPESPDQADSESWRKKSYLFRALMLAEELNGNHPEFFHAYAYWMKTRPEMPDKTRATIDLDFTGMGSGPLGRGKLGDLFSTTTNVTPEDCFDGKVLVINVPLSDWRTDGQYAALIMQTSFYRATLRRAWNPKLRPVFLFADEAQCFTTESDSDYHAVCRSHGVSVVRMTQNIPGFLKAYGGTQQAQHQVDGILGNLATALFCRNACPVTNAWASKMIAREVVYRSSVSKSGQREASTTLSEAYEDSAPPEIFLGLKNGGVKNDYVVESILFAGGRLFKRKHRWLVRRFLQQV